MFTLTYINNSYFFLIITSTPLLFSESPLLLVSNLVFILFSQAVLFGLFDTALIAARFEDLEISKSSIFILFLIIIILMCPIGHPSIRVIYTSACFIRLDRY